MALDRGDWLVVWPRDRDVEALKILGQGLCRVGQTGSDGFLWRSRGVISRLWARRLLAIAIAVTVPLAIAIPVTVTIAVTVAVAISIALLGRAIAIALGGRAGRALHLRFSSRESESLEAHESLAKIPNESKQL